MPGLFSPLTIRGRTLPNRAWVSPMCMYSAVDGVVGDWHLVHLGALASGGAGLVMAEATAVEAAGRISPACPGIWTDEQAEAWQHVVGYMHGQGAVVGMQLAHAGRKASTATPWVGHDYVDPADGGWPTVGPSSIPFGALPAPRAMTRQDIESVTESFALAARRAAAIDIDVVEIHAAHGYLMHQFLSPLSNDRDDEYGGSLANRIRFPVAVAEAVRAAWPDDRPLFARISTTDWMPGGWDVEQSVTLVRALAGVGVDLIDASSGGLHHQAVMPTDVDYQYAIARLLRERTGVLTAAVGRITDAQQAEGIIREGGADAVFLARQMLRDPHWPLRAAHELGASITWPKQYARAASWTS